MIHAPPRALLKNLDLHLLAPETAAVGTPLPVWTVSIVSHGHAEAVRRLLADFRRLVPIRHVEILLTLNAGEPAEGFAEEWPGALSIFRNARPCGFSANHNAAFRYARGRYFAVLDPELRLKGNPFGALEPMLDDPRCGVVTPTVIDESGRLQDNARSVVTPVALLRRYLLGQSTAVMGGGQRPAAADWVAGLFLAMRSECFRVLAGFDERYFLYCEDTDISLRARNEGLEVYVVPCRPVIHVARRKTLKDPRHFLWHLKSLAVLWSSRAFWRFLLREREARAPAPIVEPESELISK
jgi:N-acetylglucosaminyl-diphospho-decaprenol L-rhamnosyltransferase